ncbi:MULTISPECIES: hypothetical protein [unclassified Paenibacillus]|uniref:hypothetical protein n=1 Tax=unclassified Paenibacillus TaxID=185978 RepID=UPI003643EA3D
MVGRTENGQTSRYYNDGADVIAEGKVNGASVSYLARYIRDKGLVSTQQANGQQLYYMHNGHGDVTQLRDATGVIQASYTHDMWGNEIASSGTVHNPFRHSGEYWDGTTKLQNLRAG